MYGYEKVAKNLVEFLKNEVSVRGFNKVVFGLSGGLDSAVVAKLCVLAFGENAKALLMPHKQSNPHNLKDALELCKNLNLDYEILPLELPQNAFEKLLKNLDSNLIRLGNLCARMRMICLYDYAFVNNALVIGTSNKSEILLGYGTIFGDLASAINPLGDLYKSDIFKLARILEIPQNIINKAPSADFFEGQSDEGELGFSYEILDSIMRLLENGVDDELILQKGFSKDALELVKRRIKQNAFKRELPQIAVLESIEG